jgi:uncharacterized protein YndB with AHSA1/START domain
MSVQQDENGKRWVAMEVEVPGTPEDVWEAIATGRGVSSWFVKTRFEPEAGTPAQVISDFGPGMEAIAQVTQWQPPHRFVAESKDLGEDGPKVATEWTVEARAGGTCVVRLVHSLFADGEQWDNQLESWEQGWPWFFQILRLYLGHFRGQDCAAFRLMGGGPEPAGAAWAQLCDALGLRNTALGEHRIAPPSAPPFAGTVVKTGSGAHDLGYLLRIDVPAAGVASTFALPLGGKTFVVLDFFLYGPEAAATVARIEPEWQAWVTKNFPMPESGAPTECV